MRVLVTGPESSGTRMLCRMLQEAGAATEHRPMPMLTHGHPLHPDGLWSDLAALEWDQAVLVLRDPHCTYAAQVSAGHARDRDHAIRRTRRAVEVIVPQLAAAGRPWWWASYDALGRRVAVLALMDLLGLDGTKVRTRWMDANAKHYGGPEWADHRRLPDGRLAPQHSETCRAEPCMAAAR